MHSRAENQHDLRQPGRMWALGCALTVLFVLGSWPCPVQADISVSMTADRAQLAIDEHLVLQIEVTSDSLQGPEIELPSLDDFEVVQQSVQKPMRFSFGMGGQQVRSSTVYRFVLRPRHEGRINIGAVNAKQGHEQAKSKQLVVVVGAGNKPANRTPDAVPESPEAENEEAASGQVVDHGNYVDAQQVDPHAFIRTVVDKSRPYEGEQITATLYLYTRERLHTPPTIDQEPSTEGLWTQDLLDGQTLEQVRPQQVGRYRYHVYVLRRFAAFPIREHDVSIGSMALTIEPQRSLFDVFGPGRAPQTAIKRKSVVVPLDVKPLPEPCRPAGEVVVGAFTLDEKLDRTQAATGDAVTLTATISGRGYIQGARVTMPEVDGLEILTPQLHDLIDVQDDRVGGSKVFEWLIVPQKPGSYQLPPLVLQTFDPATGKYAAVRGPSLTLTAAGQALQVATDDSQVPSKPVVSDGDKPLSLAPIRTKSALLRKRAPIHAQPWFQLALFLPPFILLSTLAVDVARRRARNRVPSNQEISLRESQRHLAAAHKFAAASDGQRFFAEVAHALHDVLEHVLGQPVGSFTNTELARRLGDAGMEEMLSTELLDVLRRCDAARFTPSDESSAHLEETLAAAKRLLGRLQSWKTQAAGARS